MVSASCPRRHKRCIFFRRLFSPSHTQTSDTTPISPSRPLSRDQMRALVLIALVAAGERSLESAAREGSAPTCGDRVAKRARITGPTPSICRHIDTMASIVTSGGQATVARPPTAARFGVRRPRTTA